MTLEELILELKKIADESAGDYESDHCDADSLLLKFINDERVADAFDKIGKWYT